MCSVSISQYQPFQLNKHCHWCGYQINMLFLRCWSPTDPPNAAEIAVCFLSDAQQSTQCAWKEVGRGSAPLIKVSPLWVATQPDPGSAPDLLMRMLRRGGPTLGFSVRGVVPLSINIFLVKSWPLIHLAAHSALYKTSQCFYCKSESSARGGWGWGLSVNQAAKNSDLQEVNI